MVEWSNYWAKAIKLRDYQHTEAYMGLFSQIGELYNVKVLVFHLLHRGEASRKLQFSGLFIAKWKKRGNLNPQFPLLQVWGIHKTTIIWN